MSWENYYITNDEVLEIFKTSKNIKEELLIKLNFLIQAKIKKFKKQPYYEDLLQEGKIGLLKAIEEFDMNKSVNFFKFANWYIWHRIKVFLCWQKRSSNIYREESFEDFNPQNKYEEKERDLYINNAINNLSFMDKKIITMRFGIDCDNYSFREIGEGISLSKQRVEQIQKNIIHKLKKDRTIQGLND